jgi:hypothetical protein
MQKDTLIRLRNTVFIIGCFLVYRNAKYAYAYLLFGADTWNNLDPLLSMAIMLATGIVMAVTAAWLTTGSFTLQSLGLGTGVLKGLAWGFICTVPMFAGYAYLGEPNPGSILRILYRDLVLAGFGEELMFRGFLFGLLFYTGGWGFIPASLLSGLVFASGHLYQAQDFANAVSIFAFTTLAAAGFSWMYLAWRSLWFVVFLHGFMDLSWSLFSIPDDVTGSPMVNAFRILTIICAAIVCVRLGRYKLNGIWWRNEVTNDPFN